MRIDPYSNSFSNSNKNSYVIQDVPGEETQTEDYDSDSMGNAIKERPWDKIELIEEYLVDYQKETQIEIQEIQLEEGLPKETTNKTFGKNTQDAQTLLVTHKACMAYIHGTDTNITVCLYNSQNPLIINSGAHC
ncbi:hypothetical protein O181_005516 [Austropuccinia psidii MF-1]|uniref:Uncharacterized protein n=1 Tax=Austropuccinia psidii MF-1 TaxID=1389203 RepID=A0A9Q3BJ03_9BASI|nr:hypothetical protein [Austropuccinia psidii MF-1]